MCLERRYICANSLQSCPTFCDPMDCSPPGSSVHGFSRQEYWSCQALLQQISQSRDQTHVSFCLPALAGGFLTTSATWEAPAEELLLQFTFFIRLVALVVPRQVSLHPQSSNDICNRIQSIFHFFFQDCCCCCC